MWPRPCAAPAPPGQPSTAIEGSHANVRAGILGVSIAILLLHILTQPALELVLVNGWFALYELLTTRMPPLQTAVSSFWATVAIALFVSLGPEGLCVDQTGICSL